jgi:hypothetical protein
MTVLLEYSIPVSASGYYVFRVVPSCRGLPAFYEGKQHKPPVKAIPPLSSPFLFFNAPKMNTK